MSTMLPRQDLDMFPSTSHSHDVAKGKLIVMMVLHYCPTKRDETTTLTGSWVATYGDTHGTFGWVSTDLRAEGVLVTRSRSSGGRFPFCIIYIE